MPLKLNRPDIIEDNTARIEGFSVDRINDPEGPTLNVRYTVGYTDEKGHYTPRTELGHGASAIEMGATLTSRPEPGVTLYEAIKKELYALLQTRNAVAAGRVE